MFTWLKGVWVLLVVAGLLGCDNNTPLMDKVVDEDAEGVAVMLDQGVDIEAKNSYGWTALIHASRQGHTDLIALLLERGADIDAVDSTGWTPLMRASLKGHVEAVDLLLERGADIHLSDENGWTVMHWVAQRGNEALVRRLYKAGASLSTETEDGWTPRMLAQKESHNELANLISRWERQETGKE